MGGARTSGGRTKGDEPTDAGQGRELHDYEELLASAEPVEFRIQDENRAPSTCYPRAPPAHPTGLVFPHASPPPHPLRPLTAATPP